MKKIIKKGYDFYKDLFCYFSDGWKARLFPLYLKSFVVLLLFYLNRFRQSLYTKGLQIKKIDEEKVEKLKKTVQGLHALLPPNPLFTYSILIRVRQPHSSFFKTALQSVLNQTTPFLEILIGFEGEQFPALNYILEELSKEYPQKIRLFQFDQKREDLTLNQLARQAKSHFLLIMGQEDWIRPDLLFRYEQTLRLMEQPENVCLYCNENQINEKGFSLPLSEGCKCPIQFPYFFESFQGFGLLIPKKLWDKMGGLRGICQGAEYEDLLLRLDVGGSILQLVPICLYSRRVDPKPIQQPLTSKEALLKVLSDYSEAKGLDWKWEAGFKSNYVRAIPPLPQRYCTQVIIPFKDQKEFTLRCVRCILKQKGVKIKVTAVDNASCDPSIGHELRLLGIEVLSISEPFNYSRLNNLAVKQTQAIECQTILFLNNDVELEEGALAEMLRWIDQPTVGMVGCRLHYPDGRLQHGGVHLDYYDRPPHQVQWDHIEKLRSFEEMDKTKMLRVTDAVTTACALVKREVFLKVGGFDEIWYPIGYSDTNLALKLQALGLKCFYTPYAWGVHYESLSRKQTIEDYESSRWLHQLTLEKQKNLFLANSERV